jgi:hypothetical protein
MSYAGADIIGIINATSSVYLFYNYRFTIEKLSYFPRYYFDLGYSSGSSREELLYSAILQLAFLIITDIIWILYENKQLPMIVFVPSKKEAFTILAFICGPFFLVISSLITAPDMSQCTENNYCTCTYDLVAEACQS